jgi:hypothetical protein
MNTRAHSISPSPLLPGAYVVSLPRGDATLVFARHDVGEGRRSERRQERWVH